MAGYVASARLGVGTIRVDRPRGVGVTDRSSSASQPIPRSDSLDDALEDVRVVRSWASAELRDRLAAIRRAWTQTTFYLFNPYSWR